jgi:hypothetical protein
MSPFEDKAGVAEWQTSRMPIDARPPSKIANGNEGGTRILNTIARRIMIV